MDVGPADRFHGILFTEKEGFNSLWNAVHLQERFDIAIASTKGMTVTAFRELVDELVGQNPELRVFTLTDFDTTGVQIAHWVSASGDRYTFENNIEVERIGVTFEQAQDLHEAGLSEPGKFTVDEGRMAMTLGRVGCSPAEINFLAHEKLRVELNALTSEELVALVEDALSDLGNLPIYGAAQD